MFNKTHRDILVELSIPESEGSIEIIGKQPLIEKENYSVITFLVKRRNESITKRKSTVTVEIRAEGKKITTRKTTFIGPIHS